MFSTAVNEDVWQRACHINRRIPDGDGGATLLWTIFVILLIAWLLGLVGVYQIGSLVWLLFVAAIIALIVQLATGRRTVV